MEGPKTLERDTEWAGVLPAHFQVISRTDFPDQSQGRSGT
jgi:hypothetical protein